MVVSPPRNRLLVSGDHFSCGRLAVDPIAFLLETVIVPSFFVGGVWVFYLLLSRGKPQERMGAAIQALAMVVGASLGLYLVLDRMPFPPRDTLGWMLVGWWMLSAIFATAGGIGLKPKWQIGILAVIVGGYSVYMLPRGLGWWNRSIIGSLAGLSGLLVGLAYLLKPVSLSLAEPADQNPESLVSSEQNPGQDHKVVSEGNRSSLAQRVWSGPGLLLGGSFLAVFAILGGTATTAQLYGVLCSVLGPAIVFGFIKTPWRLQDSALFLGLGLMILLGTVGVSLNSMSWVACWIAILGALLGSIIRNLIPTWKGELCGWSALIWGLIGALSWAIAHQPSSSWN